jgi:hypothetical protein
MADFARDEKVILAQQIIHFIDASRLRIFYRHKASFNLTCGNGTEYIGKAPVGNWSGLSTKICSYCFVTKSPSFALERGADGWLCVLFLFRLLIDLICHLWNSSRSIV